MRKISNILFQFTLFGLTLTGLNTQAQNLQIQNAIYNLPDTVSYGDTANISVYIKNADTVPFSGSMSLYMGLDTNMQLPVIDSTSLFINNFLPGDSVPMSFLTIFDTTSGANGQHFRTGNNIVVVWPKTTNINGSAQKEVFIETPLYASKNELLLPDPIPYPNPTKDKVNVPTSYKTEELKLYNNMGVAYPVRMMSKGSIDLSEIPSGIYFLHILHKDKPTVYKILKE